MSVSPPTVLETLTAELDRLHQRRARLAADLELARQEIVWIEAKLIDDDRRIAQLRAAIAERNGDGSGIDDHRTI